MLKEAVPRYRAMLREQASSASRRALRVLRQPTKVAMLLGGNLAAQFLLAIILGTVPEGVRATAPPSRS